MSWDMRATVRRESRPSDEGGGVRLVYLGLTEQAAAAGECEPAELRIGDAFRLLPGAAITFGRDRLCEITIDSTRLGPVHAAIVLLPGGQRLGLIHLAGAGTTVVHGRHEPVHLIAPGAELVLGEAFRFRCQPAA